MTDLTDLIKPTYYSSCVRVCHWVQALLSQKPSQTALSELHITTRIPLRKETCSLTANIAQIIPENHKLSLKIPEVNEQRRQRWQKADKETQSEDLLRRRRPTREEQVPAGEGEQRRAATVPKYMFNFDPVTFIRFVHFPSQN
jgi:hypothetical protein